MDALAASREEGLRRTLMLAIPVGTQLGTVGLESLGRAADGTVRLATWSLTSAVRTAGAGAAFVNRNVLAPLSSFAFGASTSPTYTQFCTKSCPQLVPQEGRRQHTSRSQARFQRVSSSLRSGSAKCSIRRQQPQRSGGMASTGVVSRQADVLTHLAASCALIPSSELQSEQSEDGNVTQWTVNTLGLQSSLL